tara:strand:- start:11105 stop:12124 length:1020 start_codon:yes stop_codon:yes gene_type:complete
MMRAVTIVGGGLAGLSLGVALSQRGIKVQVWEAGALPRHRVCGEFICGVEQQTLECLGVASELSDALVHRRATWYDANGRKIFAGELPKKALGLSRFALDLRLVEKIRRLGGEVLLGERWRGDATNEAVVVASGRTAERTPWMGFKLHIAGELPPDLTLFLGPGGYVGLCPVEGGQWNLCGLFRKRPEVRAGKEEILRSYAEAAGMGPVEEILSRCTVEGGSAAGVAGVSFSLPRGVATELRLGDAWGVIPPFTGNGMSIAFESAELALNPIVRWFRGGFSWDEVVREVEQRHRKRFNQRFRVANLVHPLLMNPRSLGALGYLSRARLLPFRWLFGLTR